MLVVTNELKKAGFEIQVLGNSVVVSLKRSVSTMEVQTVLEQVFGNVTFLVQKYGRGVKVSE